MNSRITFLGTLSPDRPTITGRTIPLARELAKQGKTVRIVTLGHKLSTETVDGIPIVTVGPSLRDHHPEKPSPGRIANRLWNGARALTAELTRHKDDVVVLAKAHPQNTFAAMRVKSRTVLDIDDDEIWGSRLTTVERLFMRAVERQAAHTACLITACSPTLVQRYQKRRKDIPIELIPTSIENNNEAKAPDIRKELSLPVDTPIILYIGSLAIQSGHRVDHLLDAWNEAVKTIPQAHLVLAGDGIDMDMIQERASRLPSHARIHFLGRYKASDAIGLAKQATLLVDPADTSLQAEAKSSSRMLYALATGTPIVAADGGMRSHILPESLHSTFLYKPGDVASLAHHIAITSSPEMTNLFRQKTEGLWHKWSWDHIGRQFHSLIEHVLHQ